MQSSSIRHKTEDFKLWHVLATPHPVALILTFTTAAMQHVRVKHTTYISDCVVSVNSTRYNNPVSRNEIITTCCSMKNIIAHARMRTPAEELEYACFQPCFSTLPLFLNYSQNHVRNSTSRQKCWGEPLPNICSTILDPPLASVEL